MHKKDILIKKNIHLNKTKVSRNEAIIEAGRSLVDGGYVTERYIDGMIRRDENLSVYIGNMLAIPHGEHDVMSEIKHSGIIVHVYPEGIDWGGSIVKVVVGIAGLGDEHLQILSNIAEVFTELERVEQVIESQSVDAVYDILMEANHE